MATIVHTVKIAANTKEAVTAIATYGNQIVWLGNTIKARESVLSGEKILKSANDWTAAVAKMGGATKDLVTTENILAGAAKLTVQEQAKVHDAVARAIEKYTALGKQAPSAMLELEKATRSAADTTKSAETATVGLSTKMIALGAAIGTALGAIAVKALSALGRAIGDIVMGGAKLSSISTSFHTLAQSVGETGESMLAATRSATKGLISDMSIMATANKAVLLGLPVTSKEMGTLATSAIVLGRAMGQDATKSLDDLITALGRSSPMILDNLGLTVKVGEANETYAKQIGKTSAQLTDAEKKMAFYNAAMEAAGRKVVELGASI